MSQQQDSSTREDYPLIKEIVTRWSDFDLLRHLNNVEYYRYFEYLILDNLEDLGTDWITDPVIPFVVESNCHFRKPIPKARKIDGGLRVKNIGKSSVRYEIALFEQGATIPSATGYFVHVYIDRDSEKAVPVPDTIRSRLSAIAV